MEKMENVSWKDYVSNEKVSFYRELEKNGI